MSTGSPPGPATHDQQSSTACHKNNLKLHADVDVFERDVGLNALHFTIRTIWLSGRHLSRFLFTLGFDVLSCLQWIYFGYCYTTYRNETYLWWKVPRRIVECEIIDVLRDAGRLQAEQEHQQAGEVAQDEERHLDLVASPAGGRS